MLAVHCADTRQPRVPPAMGRMPTPHAERQPQRTGSCSDGRLVPRAGRQVLNGVPLGAISGALPLKQKEGLTLQAVPSKGEKAEGGKNAVAGAHEDVQLQLLARARGRWAPPNPPAVREERAASVGTSSARRPRLLAAAVAFGGRGAAL